MYFSVVIPATNSTILRYCLIALSRQSLKPSQVVISISTSNSEQIKLIQGLAQEFGAEWTAPEKRDNRSAARNIGVSKCTQNVVLLLDQDIILNLNYLNILYAQIAHFYWHHFLAHGTVHYLEPVHGLKLHGGCTPDYQFNHWLDASVQSYDGFHLFQPEYISSDWVCSNNLSFKKHSWDEFGLQFDEEYDGWGEEDVDLGCQAEAREAVFVRFKCLALHATHRVDVQRNSFNFSRNILRLFSKYPHMIKRQHMMLSNSGTVGRILPPVLNKTEPDK